MRGEFLEGFSLSDAPEFDDWVSLQREAWHQKASQVFDAFSQIQFEGGEHPRALATTLRWVAMDMFNEAAHRRLMQVHLALGERAQHSSGIRSVRGASKTRTQRRTHSGNASPGGARSDTVLLPR